MLMRTNCIYPPCGRPLPPRHRKYCSDHSREATRLRKLDPKHRAHYLDFWIKKTGSLEAARAANRAYMREYMRRRRATQRLAQHNVQFHRPRAVIRDS